MIRTGSYVHSLWAGSPRFRDYLRRMQFNLWWKKLHFKSGLYRVKIDPTRILLADPQNIINVGVGWGKSEKLREFGKIVGGDWDLNTMPFEDLSVYQSLKARFVHSAQWEDTSYYQSIVDELSQGIHPWGVRTESDLVRRLNSLDTLFDTIQKNGYKTQRQLMSGRTALCMLDEVTIRIGRNGELLFSDGRHRLAIAKILKLQKIPIVVTWRHRDWIRFRAEILRFIKNTYDGKLYHPLTHPDLCNIPSVLQEDVFQLIKSHISVNGHSLLHIGAHWGYFCHKFEDEGYHCYAVEEDPRHYHFLTKLKIAEGRQFTTARSDICTIFEKSNYDVILALNVLHRYLKTADSYDRFVKFLKRLRTNVIFFAPHSLRDVQMQGAYRNYGNADFMRFIAKYTNLSHYECIGYIENGVPIYKLTGD